MCLLCLLLTSCALKVTSNSTSIKQVEEMKLNDGTVTRIGFQPVESNWNCSVLAKRSSNAALDKVKGAFKIGNQFQVMQEAAIDYANQAQLKPNYIYLYVPTTVAVGRIDSSVVSDSDTTYYRCDTVPEIRNGLSGLFK